MSWNRCTSWAATKNTEPAATSIVSPELVNFAPAGRHDVDLVLGVRLLGVLGAGEQRVRAEAEVGPAQVLDVRRARAVRLTEPSGVAEALHGPRLVPDRTAS